MQPLGRQHCKLPAKEDFHPPKGYINWWENIVTPKKKRARREAKVEIKYELDLLS